MNEYYQGVCCELLFFVLYGIWVCIVDKLVLINSKGEKFYFCVKGDKLEMFDCNGSFIQFFFNYILELVKVSLLMMLMVMCGMYFYMVDVVIFIDCVIGKCVVVVNNVQFEWDYVVVCGIDICLVLLVVEGYFIFEVNLDIGEMMKMLMMD